jgi:hypothetical protein
MAPSHLGDRPPGRLATMACPRGGDWLDGEMEGLLPRMSMYSSAPSLISSLSS